jgi:serine/threonine protein kinase
MAVELSSAEPLAGIAGYRATARLSRQPPEGEAYDAVGEDGRHVDLWVVPARDHEFAKRFLEGAEALAGLEHDNLPRILDAGEADQGLYLATEPIDGPAVSDLIGEGEGISPMRAVRVLGEAADGLDAAHAAGVLHLGLSRRGRSIAPWSRDSCWQWLARAERARQTTSRPSPA